jgi:SAM-dependent methyltransferase
MTDAFFAATAMPDADWWQALWPDPWGVLAKMDIEAGMVAVDLCCGDGLFTAPLCGLAGRVFAIDIDPEMLARAKVLVAAKRATNCDFILADAMRIETVVPQPVDYVFFANTFHGVPDKTGLTQAVAAILKVGGMFGIVNWHRQRREETVVLGQPRGPRTEMRIEPVEVARAVEPAGLRLLRTVELPPFHYGIIFEKPPN